MCPFVSREASIGHQKRRTLGQLSPVSFFTKEDRGGVGGLSKIPYKVLCPDSTPVYPDPTSALSDKEIANQHLLLQMSRKHVHIGSN